MFKGFLLLSLDFDSVLLEQPCLGAVDQIQFVLGASNENRKLMLNCGILQHSPTKNSCKTIDIHGKYNFVL